MLKWMKKILPKTKNLTPEEQKRDAEARLRYLDNKVMVLQRRIR